MCSCAIPPTRLLSKCIWLKYFKNGQQVYSMFWLLTDTPRRLFPTLIWEFNYFHFSFDPFIRNNWNFAFITKVNSVSSKEVSMHQYRFCKIQIKTTVVKRIVKKKSNSPNLIEYFSPSFDNHKHFSFFWKTKNAPTHTLNSFHFPRL